MTPAWILDILATLMLVVAAVSAARLGLATPWRPGAVVTDTDVSHLFMGIAMAGMLASSLTTLPNAAWEAIFAVFTMWFGFRVVRDARSNGARGAAGPLAGGHCAPHLVHSAAMLYMFLALAAPAAGGSGMAGMGGGSTQTLKYPTLAFVFALILIGYTIWDLDQLSGKRYSRAGASLSLASVAVARVPTAGGPPLAAAEPGALASAAVATGDTVGCRIAMGAAMAFMLLIMI
jgi:hypothetical protein